MGHKQQNLYVATIAGAGNSKEFLGAWVRNNGPTPKAPSGTARLNQIGSKDRQFVAELLSVAEALRQIRSKSDVTVYTDSAFITDLIDDSDIVPLLRRARNQKNPQLKKAAKAFQQEMVRHQSVSAIQVNDQTPTLIQAYALAAHLKDNLAGHGARKGIEIRESKGKAPREEIPMIDPYPDDFDYVYGR